MLASLDGAGTREPEMMCHDQSYKALFSHPQAVRDLLCEFVADLLEGGREWVQRLDFDTLEPLPTEHVGTTLRARLNDLVWRVRFADTTEGPEWLHVLLMLEFQSSVEWFMALRVQVYAGRLYQSLRRVRRPGLGTSYRRCWRLCCTTAKRVGLPRSGWRNWLSQRRSPSRRQGPHRPSRGSATN